MRLTREAYEKLIAEDVAWLEGVRNHRISVQLLGSGYAAVHLADYEDMNWGTDVVQTGMGRYSKRESAVQEATAWAAADGIRLDLPEAPAERKGPPTLEEWKEAVEQMVAATSAWNAKGLGRKVREALDVQRKLVMRAEASI